MPVDSYYYSNPLLDDFPFLEQCLLFDQNDHTNNQAQQQLLSLPEDVGISTSTTTENDQEGDLHHHLLLTNDIPDTNFISNGGVGYPSSSSYNDQLYQPRLCLLSQLLDDATPHDFMIHQPSYNKNLSFDPIPATAIMTTKRHKSAASDDYDDSYYYYNYSFPAHYYDYLGGLEDDTAAAYYYKNHQFNLTDSYSSSTCCDRFISLINDPIINFSDQFTNNNNQSQLFNHLHSQQGAVKGEAARESSSPTPQSKAARVRRRKISDKLTQLGKLIPTPTKGGSNSNSNSNSNSSSKMMINSTAEMLQAAFKYVKFMQAQHSLLQLINNSSSAQTDQTQDQEEEEEEASPVGVVSTLEILGSYLVQEKLYTNDKCLVPMEFVAELAKDMNLAQNNPSLSLELKQFVNVVTQLL